WRRRDVRKFESNREKVGWQTVKRPKGLATCLCRTFTDESHRAAIPPEDGTMNLRSPGSILIVSCYELGHQPLGAALPLAFLERAGFAPDALDIAVQTFDEAKVARARLVAISVPMHTALRLGVRVAERVRQLNPAAAVCFYGLYAALNADYLLEHGGDYCIGGECETPLVALAEALDVDCGTDFKSVLHRNGPIGRLSARPGS